MFASGYLYMTTTEKKNRFEAYKGFEWIVLLRNPKPGYRSSILKAIFVPLNTYQQEVYSESFRDSQNGIFPNIPTSREGGSPAQRTEPGAVNDSGQ